MAAPLKPKEKAALLAAHGASDLTLHRTANGFAPRNRPEKLFTRRVMNWLDERVLIRYDDPQLPRKATLTDPISASLPQRPRSPRHATWR